MTYLFHFCCSFCDLQLSEFVLRIPGRRERHYVGDQGQTHQVSHILLTVDRSLLHPSSHPPPLSHYNSHCFTMPVMLEIRDRPAKPALSYTGSSTTTPFSQHPYPLDRTLTKTTPLSPKPIPFPSFV